MAGSGKVNDKESRVEPQAPNLKTWVLKVPIHCEGCKKKVKRIVTKTEGVVGSDVDIKEQKVTVIGNIDVNALIARLVKRMGKPAELWPEVKSEQKEKRPSKPKPHKEKPPMASEDKSVEEVENVEGRADKEKTKIEAPIRDPSIESKSEEAANSTAVKSTEAAITSRASEDTEVKVKPTSETKPEQNVEVKAPKPTEKVESEKAEHKQTATVDGSADGGDNGNVAGKKKKKKGQNEKQKSEAQEDATREPKPHRHLRNHSPPLQHQPQPPPYSYGPPPSYQAPPIYTVSYNTTTPYPSSSYETPSYYAVTPLHNEAYTIHSNSDPPAEYPPSDFVPYQSQPPDSFGMFSDENPNACSLM